MGRLVINAFNFFNCCFSPAEKKKSAMAADLNCELGQQVFKLSADASSSSSSSSVRIGPRLLALVSLWFFAGCPSSPPTTPPQVSWGGGEGGRSLNLGMKPATIDSKILFPKQTIFFEKENIYFGHFFLQICVTHTPTHQNTHTQYGSDKS